MKENSLFLSSCGLCDVCSSFFFSLGRKKVLYCCEVFLLFGTWKRVRKGKNEIYYVLNPKRCSKWKKRALFSSPSNYTVALHELLALSQNFASFKWKSLETRRPRDRDPYGAYSMTYRPFSSAWLERRAYKHFFLFVGVLLITSRLFLMLILSSVYNLMTNNTSFFHSFSSSSSEFYFVVLQHAYFLC